MLKRRLNTLYMWYWEKQIALITASSGYCWISRSPVDSSTTFPTWRQQRSGAEKLALCTAAPQPPFTLGARNVRLNYNRMGFYANYILFLLHLNVYSGIYHGAGGAWKKVSQYGFTSTDLYSVYWNMCIAVIHTLHGLIHCCPFRGCLFKTCYDNLNLFTACWKNEFVCRVSAPGPPQLTSVLTIPLRSVNVGRYLHIFELKDDRAVGKYRIGRPPE